jgi:hypothetical protein
MGGRPRAARCASLPMLLVEQQPLLPRDLLDGGTLFAYE